MNNLYSGVCPVMLTPFTDENKIDFNSLEKLTDWYIKNGASSLFAVCQSSEMFTLSSQERVSCVEFIKKYSSVPVFSVGNVSEDRDMALEEINKMINSGADGIVLITNTLVPENASSEEWMSAVQWFLDRIPENIAMGLYECPVPYKHLITDDELRFIVSTQRFSFIKDTCCDVKTISRRLKIIGDSKISLFNANSTTLLDTLREGCAGFCGILANFDTELIVWLCKNYDKQPQKAEFIQSVLSVTSKFGDNTYPINAKEFLRKKEIIETNFSRTKDNSILTELDKADLDELSLLFDYSKSLISEGEILNNLEKHTLFV